ncbi:hypothetical protein TH53_21930 [Pedobacter lusitanus]|uniref:N-acetyltransferase domain-containing protein n=1 Tax=Pedobacter lusitanus TaxID=1503925 RepID=A0A0D0FRU4_9SPHI|nr:GNAT family N-acetyltransferase [Pedobacter lusitanus]KIO75194.1 hypothetical protein TH53_21930 [Pedobacter lusitanus]
MIQDEKIVIDNLFEFWDFTGNLSKTILSAEDFKAVYPKNSDWPKRIFSLKNDMDPKTDVFEKISAQIGNGSLPNMLTLTESMSNLYQEDLSEAGFIPKMKQRGMRIDLSGLGFIEQPSEYKFKTVSGAAEADLFASIASASFKYQVDGRIIELLSANDHSIRLFIGYFNETPAACGLVFYDRYGNAGLHMIGTLPEFRGKGLAYYMTVHLMTACIEDGRMTCVLHASEAGEKVYLKLGFIPVKQIIGYSLPLLN